MKRWFIQLTLFLLIGLVLASATFDIIRGLQEFGRSEILGRLSFSGAGVGISAWAILLLVVVFTIDAIWILLLVTWIIRKLFHIESKDIALYLL